MKTRVMIVPKGDWPHWSGVLQVVDDASIKSQAAYFREDRPILVGRDHMEDLDPTTQKVLEMNGVANPTDAAGWITMLYEESDGLYGDIEWTPTGASDVAGGVYKYLSPSWAYSDVEMLEDDKIRPIKLTGLTVTNRPNITAIPAIANSDDKRIPTFGGIMQTLSLQNAEEIEKLLINKETDTIAENLIEEKIEEKGELDMPIKAKVCEILGLPEDTSDEKLYEELSKMKNSIEEMRMKEEEAKKKQEEMEIENALNEYQNRYTDREVARQMLLANREGVIAIWKMMPEPKIVERIVISNSDKNDTIPNMSEGVLPIAPTTFSNKEELDKYCKDHPGVTRAQAYQSLYNRR